MATTPGRGLRQGFSLVEMLIAISAVFGIAAATFQLFVQNERLFRDQQIILEMHQSARAVAFMIADDIYGAGQSVPVFAASQERQTPDSSAVFLSGTDATRIQFRGADEIDESTLADSVPLLFENGRQRTVWPQSTQFRPATGSHLFMSGPSGKTWTWVRARVDGRTSGGELEITPVAISSEGGLLTRVPQVAVEHAVSYRLSGRSLLRGELRGFTASGDPLFRELSVGDDFTDLEFRYYDSSGQVVTPLTLEERNAIRSVNVRLEAETAQPLSTGLTRRYSVAVSVSPRNLEVR